MADWKQITARIRRARGSKNPEEQLSNLFQKTRDAMVAFELARHLEGAGQREEAVKWYATAAERFRRADWKTKAHEAITRLGGQAAAGAETSEPSDSGEEVAIAGPAAVAAEPTLPSEQNVEVFEAAASVASEEAEVIEIAAGNPQKPDGPNARPHRRRGRRGGRNRRRGGHNEARVAPSPPVPGAGDAPRADMPTDLVQEPAPRDVSEGRAIPKLPVEPAAEIAGVGMKGRYGDPGLSSRLSLLEMQFRRLLTCAPARVDRAETAPAGPGVFVLTDEEMVSYYYVEACDTLRVAIGNMARGGVSRRGNPSIKPMLADYLGIPETRVGKYMADHCVVRWLQLDEGAPHLAHFAIAVLRPALNE